MLAYLVEEMLAGRGNELKGYTIDVAVFRRGDDFDAQSDPVVRLEARRLRRDLAGYYVSAGRANPLRISIPTGHYAPEVRLAGADGPSAEAGETAPVPDAGESNQDGVAAPITGNAGGRARNRSRLVAGSLVVLAFIAGLAYLFFGLWPAEDNSETASARGPAVMVLPFRAHGDGTGVPSLAAGISESLIADLNRFPDVRLYVPTADGAKTAPADPVGTAKRQGAAFVLTGSVNAADTGVRIGGQLVDVTSGQVIWAEQFDRPLEAESLLTAQSEIATAIATALGQPYGIIKTELTDRLPRAFTPSMPSYECVLRAYAYRRNFAPELHALPSITIPATSRNRSRYSGRRSPSTRTIRIRWPSSAGGWLSAATSRRASHTSTRRSSGRSALPAGTIISSRHRPLYERPLPSNARNGQEERGRQFEHQLVARRDSARSSRQRCGRARGPYKDG